MVQWNNCLQHLVKSCRNIIILTNLGQTGRSFAFSIPFPQLK